MRLSFSIIPGCSSPQSEVRTWQQALGRRLPSLSWPEGAEAEIPREKRGGAWGWGGGEFMAIQLAIPCNRLGNEVLVGVAWACDH